MKLNNKKSGFTLAEVLVTLMIIGVIAAMTIPSLMQTTAQQEYKAAFKKALSLLNQTITLSYAIDGIDATDATGTNFYDFLTQRLNVMSSVPEEQELYTADGMWFKVMLTGERTSQRATNCSKNLTDGNLNTGGNICSIVKVDVNGAKGPNTWTESSKKIKDLFEITVYPQSALPANKVFAEALYSK